MDPTEGTPAWSLERRLRKRLLGSLLLLWLAGAGAAFLALREETGEVLDSALLETAQRLLVLPEAALVQDDDAAHMAVFGPHEEYLVYQVFDADGRLRLRSHQAPEAPLATGTASGVADVGDWRVLTLTRPDGQRVAQVAEALAHRAEVMWESSLWLLLPLLAVLPLSAWVLHGVLRAGFRTLEPARAALAGSAAGDLRPLPLTGMPEELLPLLLATNGMTERVRMAIEAERSFAARSAHELRTPLAAARAQAQRLQKQAGGGELAGHAAALVRQIDRITALASRLLQMARVESGVAWKRGPVDLALLARLVIDEFTEARPGGRLQLAVAADAGTVPGDTDALGIALRNLVDNALRHGGPGAFVRVEVGAGRIAVLDDGPGVPAAELPRLVRPFERGASASEGSGLGLAMVDTVARQSGARLQLRSPTEGGRGFEARLEFPPAA